MVAAARYPPSTPSHAMLLPRPRHRAAGQVLFRASFPGPDPRAGSAPSSVLLELARRSSSMPIHRPCLRPAAPGLGGSLLHASAARARRRPRAMDAARRSARHVAHAPASSPWTPRALHRRSCSAAHTPPYSSVSITGGG
jgi:hypothetical protein